MFRREFILSSAAALAFIAETQAQGAQRPKVIGFIAGGVRPTPIEGSLYDAFPQGMKSLGYVGGRDFVME